MPQLGFQICTWRLGGSLLLHSKGLSLDTGSLRGFTAVLASVCLCCVVKHSFEKPVRIHLQSVRSHVKARTGKNRRGSHSDPRLPLGSCCNGEGM